MLRSRFGDNARSVIIDRCKRGLLDGRGEVVVRSYENCFERGWDGYLERHIDVPLEDSRIYRQILPPDFWLSAFATASAEETNDNDAFDRQVWADWDVGDFGYREVWPSSDVTGIARCDVAGMKFNAQHLALFAKPADPVRIERKSRTSLYDWEAVLTALAGELSQGLLVPDAFEHGAQATIERWMLDWFSAEFDAAPNESTVRPKAAAVLKAIQAAQKRADEGARSKD